MLNTNRLSLDGMADLNAGLRDTILEENWNKHDLAMTFFRMALDMAISINSISEAEVKCSIFLSHESNSTITNISLALSLKS